MPRSTQATSKLFGAAFLCFAAVGAGVYLTLSHAGGGGTATPSTPAPTNAAANPDPANEIRSYTVRGTIIALPDKTGKQLLDIHHEPIPDFVGKSGKVVGMKEMIMPFADLAPGVTLDGLAVGDAIEFVFEVRWNAPPRTLVTKISTLPPGTALKLGPVLEQGK